MVYRNRPGYIYLFSHPDSLLKIGFTVSLGERVRAVSRGTDNAQYIPRKRVTVESVIEDGADFQSEQLIHALFQEYRIGSKRSEWYQDRLEIRKHFESRNAFVFSWCGCGSWRRSGICVDEFQRCEKWHRLQQIQIERTRGTKARIGLAGKDK